MFASKYSPRKDDVKRWGFMFGCINGYTDRLIQAIKGAVNEDELCKAAQGVLPPNINPLEACKIELQRVVGVSRQFQHVTDQAGIGQDVEELLSISRTFAATHQLLSSDVGKRIFEADEETIGLLASSHHRVELLLNEINSSQTLFTPPPIIIDRDSLIQIWKGTYPRGSIPQKIADLAVWMFQDVRNPEDMAAGTTIHWKAMQKTKALT